MGRVSTVAVGVAKPIGSVRVIGTSGGDPNSPEPQSDAQVVQQMRAALETERGKIGSVLAALQQAAVQLNEAREQMVNEVEEQLLELAVDIAGKILMQEVEAGKYDMKAMITEALSHVPMKQNIVVRLHPEDHAQCSQVQEGQDAGELGGIKLVPDPGVRKAQCIVETSEGTVESSVEAHLEDVSEVLKSPQ